MSAGGVKEQRDDWCTAARTNLEKALIENMSAMGVKATVLKVTTDMENEVDEVKTLYRTVMYSVYSHAYYWEGQNTDFFPDRLKNFDYSVGSLEKLLKMQKVNGLLLVEASDEISSAGRKALRVVQALNPFGIAASLRQHRCEDRFGRPQGGHRVGVLLFQQRWLRSARL